MAAHPGLEEEQAHLDRAYERVDALRATAAALLQSALAQRGGTPQAVAERDVVVSTTLNRLQQLDVGDRSLCFGRIDREDGERYHIGRLAVSGEDQEPLVVDWRAPVAEPFYRATGREPMGLVRRRHFATEGRRLTAIEDEVFGDLDVALGGDLGGPGSVVSSTLLTALEQSRTGRMRDIVATVQREQDEVIRAELPGVLVVQGGPGTGKTAVALHRAAYLLYTHRFPLERQGVLVVGPNPLFVRYIEQVLPSLGESGVVLTTVEGLVPTVRVRAEDPPAAARVKSDARMAELVARAVRDRQRPLRRDVEVGFEGFALRLSAEDSRKAVAAARRRPGPHNARRRHVEAAVGRRLYAQYREAASRRAAWRSPGDGDGDGRPGLGEGGLDESELWRAVRHLPAVQTALERMWPLLSPEELLHDLYGAPALLRLAGRGLLSEEEQAILHRPRSSSLYAIPWTAADLPLLDEARMLLGPRRATAGEDDDVRAYGHIVVDEAQDLSPMQLRMLARRSLSGSMTVVGDIAQATGQRAPATWDEVTMHLPYRHPPRVSELTVNYRTPGEIMDLAARVLAVTAPHLQPPRSVRNTGTVPVVMATSPAELSASVARVVASEVGDPAIGTLAVVAPSSLSEAVRAALAAAGIPFGDADHNALESQVTLVPPSMVKGLEFDVVVVVEPAAIVAESSQGLRALYVALTRATRRLTVLHAEALPEPLLAALPGPHAEGEAVSRLGG